MEKIKNFVRAHILVLTVAAVIGGLFVLFVGGPGLIDWLASARYERARAKYEQKIETLEKAAQANEQSARDADARAVAKEKELAETKAALDVARQVIAGLDRRQVKEGKRYEKAKQEIDSISDYDTLRNLNCERRKQLGYPCDE